MLHLDIPAHLNKALKIERIENDIKNMQELIILILEQRYGGKESE